ncbi:MAG: hypothetical protein Q9227_000244 [Pyrenula ochraceoflavens]
MSSTAPPPEPRNPDEAQKIINDIRKERGHLDEVDELELRKTSEGWREDYMRRAAKQRSVHATFTELVAKQLYTSRFKCIQEILQNADDAEYDTSVTPRITFTIRATEMIVDINERGFTRRNVEALCSTGESSKIQSENSTGEKGIGFKSVFNVARKVHVQSGCWSFRFEYRRGEDGLGMVTPIWTPMSAEPLPSNIGTRFRMTYEDDSSKFVAEIRREFENNLSDTTLFALRTLKEIDVVFERVAGYEYSKRLKKRETQQNANFELAANREAIPDQPWNRRLREGVVEALQKAIIMMSNEKTYNWPKYLPGARFAGFWGPLYDGIKGKLQTSCVLESRRGRLACPLDLRTIPSIFTHHGLPLFDDTEKDVYLSTNYDKEDIDRLRYLGLKDLSISEMIDRVQNDMDSNPSSKLRGSYKSDDWHTSFTGFLAQIMKDKNARTIVWKLPIIPLSNSKSEWVTPESFGQNPVYFPNLIQEGSVTIPIPEHLGFRKLHPIAYAISARANFYASIGVSGCSPNLVIRKILECQDSILSRRIGVNIGIGDDILAQNEILFWFGDQKLALKDVKKSGVNQFEVHATDQKNKVRQCSKLFFASKEPFSAHELLRKSSPNDFKGFGFLGHQYMQSQVQNSIRNGRTWMQFLESLGVRSYPTLLHQTPSGKSLHPILDLVARDNPQNFVPNLKEHWHDCYSKESWSLVTEQLRTIQVPCQDGMTRHLMHTILPTYELVDYAEDFHVRPHLAFLSLPDNALANGENEWHFLEEFGVICRSTIEYYVESLRALKTLPLHEPEIVDIKRSSTMIFGKIAQVSRNQDAKFLQSNFVEHQLIYVPNKWCNQTECLWDGCQDLQQKSVLSHVYESIPEMEDFFVNLLKIRNATYEDIIHDIEWRRRNLSTPLAQNTFEENALIYSQAWLKPTQAIWNDPRNILDQVPLEQTYPQLQEFFVNKLQTRTISADVLCQELISVCSSDNKNERFQQVKSLMFALGQTIASDPHDKISRDSLSSLRRNAFVPVCGTENSFLARQNEGFFINDHERYGEAFAGKVNIVDFTHTDLTTLQPLFALLGFEKRYLSKFVEATTVVSRAKYFNKRTDLHRLLMDARVRICDDLRTDLIIRQSDTEVKLPSERALARIDHDEHGLTIFVPGDPKGLFSCYSMEMPLHLAKVLGIQHGEAEKSIFRILNDETKRLEDIMREEDISEYPWFEKPDIAGPIYVPHTTPSSGPMQPEGSQTLEAGVHLDGTRPHVLLDQAHASQIGTQRAVTTSLSPSFQSLDTRQRVLLNKAYSQLLHRVKVQAQRLPPSFTGHNTSMERLNQDFGSLDISNRQILCQFLSLGSWDEPTFEETAPIGAAGEFFVFEHLKAIGLKGFGVENWQSNIRSYVKVYEPYGDLKDRNGPEIADIMFQDVDRTLERFLESKAKHGFPVPAASRGSAKPIEYLIEVKTTVGACSTPLFMSSDQYELMKEKDIRKDAARPKQVYVIARVYNLLRSEIGMEIYVDPWRLVESDVLKVVADKWKIVPPNPT